MPNGQSPFVFRFTLDIPDDANLGAQYCNYAKTTENPSAPQQSNRKAGPACFFIGGDIRVVKVAEGSKRPLAGATFEVSCVTPTGGQTTPPVIISGLSGPNSATTFANGAYVATGVAKTGEIAIAGPIGTVCTVTETVAPPGFDLPADPTQVLTIGRTQVTGTFVDPPLNPTISTDATSTTIGGSISDTATLTGVTDGAAGTITFELFDTPDCSGDPVFTSDPVNVDGNGTYGPVSFTPMSAGTYKWIATYSGDEGNDGAAGSCGDEGETSTVAKKATTISTSATESATVGDSISDTATLSDATAGATGTITFDLYANAGCTGDPVFTVSVDVRVGHLHPDRAGDLPMGRHVFRGREQPRLGRSVR